MEWLKRLTVSESFHVNMTYSGSVVLKKIFQWPHPIFAFLRLSPLRRGPGPLFLQFLEFPLPKHDLCQVWLKLDCWFWRGRFLKIFSKFLLFCYYLPLGKGVVFHLYNSESPLPKGWFVLTLIKIGPKVLEKSKM